MWRQVASIVAQLPGVLEANVFGVAIGSLDGRCGMVAVKVNHVFQ